METKNGYFQVIINDRGTSLKLSPPIGGGERLNVDDVKKYLESSNIPVVNEKKIAEAIQSNIDVEIALMPNKADPIKEKMFVKIVKNNMYVVARFYAPSSNGETMSKDEIIDEIKNAGVVYGIQESAIDKFVTHREYCKSMVLAKGTPVKDGEDAIITYHFNTDNRLKPTLNENGTVNFHELNNIGHIQAGALLATLTPEVQGVSGTDVLGEVIKPKIGHKKILKYGRNIKISEDKLTLTSEVNGHATIEGDKVFVSGTYVVDYDVGNSTGDIKYNGNIDVRGNVRTGFKIEATGDVEIRGIVEGAEIKADGNIVLYRGIQGMAKGVLRCKGNVIAKFIESANVSAGGYIEADSILHSNVSARGDVCIRGSKGLLVGGNTRSCTLIEATTIGSRMGTATYIEVGMDPTTQDRMKELKVEIAKSLEELMKMKQSADILLKRGDRQVLLAKTREDIKNLQECLIELQKEYDDIMSQIEENEHASVVVNKDIYPGSRLTVSGEVRNIHVTECRCRYVKSGGEVTIKPIT